jgi:hypothetical protein
MNVAIPDIHGVPRLGEVMALRNNDNTPESNNSSGPKTAAGKKRSSRNALREGFFSEGLILKEDERPEFEARCRRLKKELSPATEVQRLAFDRVMCAVYRVQIALEREMRRLHQIWTTSRRKRNFLRKKLRKGNLCAGTGWDVANCKMQLEHSHACGK